MRISDWSSDVCSSDLRWPALPSADQSPWQVWLRRHPDASDRASRDGRRWNVYRRSMRQSPSGVASDDSWRARDPPASLSDRWISEHSHAPLSASLVYRYNIQAMPCITTTSSDLIRADAKYLPFF